jgi:dolichyl-diphosphooligosaccharide--protein glycosyltransferase
LAEARESPPRSFLSKLKRGDGRPSELRKWITANWSSLFMLFFIFVLALFIRSYFAYSIASGNGYLVSGGSDSYYWQRIINYSAHTGKQLYLDPMLNFPLGIRNPRPPFYSMSVVVPAVIAQDMFKSLQDSLGWTLMWSTAFWGALTVIPTYFVGKETFGRRAGLVAAFLLAVMPSHIQRSVLSDADHDSFILFFIVLTFYFLLKAVKTQEHRKWVENWRSWTSIKRGLRDYFTHSKTPVLYSLLAGVTYGSVIMAWVGFGYATVLILVYYLIQILLNKFKNLDSTSITLIVFIAMGFGFLLSFPVYFEQTLIAVRFDVPVYLFFASMILGMLFVVSRDFPWTLTLPAIAMILIVGVLMINVIDPALGQAILSGQGYFVQNKLYSTIAEAKAPKFSELALGFGMVTFFMSLIGLVWAFLKVPKKATSEYIFIVVWLGAAIFMAISAARFMFNAAPAFAIVAAWVTVVIVDRLDFNSVRKSLVGAGGSYLRIIRRSVKIRHVVGALFLAFMVVLPNVWYATDAGIPSETKSKLDRQIYNSIPSFLRPAGYDTVNGSDWYLGAFGYSLPLPRYYFPAAWDWFSNRDSDILPESQRPAYVSWWDYGFEAIEAGGHPTVADNFQNGYQLTGNVIMAQSEQEAIAIFAYRLIQGAVVVGKEPQVFDLFEKYGVDTDRMLQIIHGPGQPIINDVLADPTVYGPMDSTLSDANARIVAARVELSKVGLENLVSLYGDLCDLTGWDIRYFSVDSRMFPRTGTDTGIFYAPAKLSDRRIISGSTPIDFYEIKAVNQNGYEYSLDQVTSDMTIVDYAIVYKDMFYKSMLYRAMGGFMGTDIGLTNDGVPGLSGSLSNYAAAPAWNLTHFRMVYRTVYYNPYPDPEYKKHADAWTAVGLEEASALQKKINSGEIEGVIDTSSSALYTAGAVFLEYYEGAYVNGTLTTEEGNPVGGMRVTIQDEYGIPHGSVLTDSNGQYSLLAPFGNITLTVSSGSAKNTGLVGTNKITSVKFNVTDNQAMRVKEDLNNDGVPDYIITKDFRMKGTETTGNIFWDLDSDGNYTANTDQLISDAIVFAKDLNTSQTFMINATDGTFDVLLPPGQYDIKAFLFGTNVTMAQRTNITAGSKSTQNLAVPACGVIGDIAYVNGTPASDIELVLTDLSSGVQLGLHTNENGTYSYNPILSGHYVLTTSAPDVMLFNALIDLASTQYLVKNLTAFPKSTIKARAVVGNSPAPYAVYMASNDYDPTAVITGQADQFGWINIEVPEGPWTIYATSYSGTSEYAGAERFDTSISSSVGGTISLVAATYVTGTLKSPSFSSLGNDYVVFEMSSGARIPVMIDSAGSFNLKLPAGTYNVTSTSTSAKGIYSSTVSVQGSSTSLLIKMSNGVVLQGFVYMDQDAMEGVSSSDIGRYAELKITDSSGRSFTTESLADGSFVAVFPKDSQAVLTLENPGYSQWSREVTATADNSSGVLVAMPDNVVVSGQVTYQGNGVRGVSVAFLPSSFLMSPFYVTTGAAGRYTVSLPATTYSVVVEQDTTPEGGERYVYDQSLLVLPSGDVVKDDIQLIKKVEMFGFVLGASDNLKLTLQGPERKDLTLTSLNYSVFVLPGTYKVYGTGLLGGAHYASMSTAVVSFSSRQHDVQLSLAYEVSGTITTGSSPAGNPVTVTATSSTGESVTKLSSAHGSYTIELPPGTYSVSYLLETSSSSNGRTLYVEWFADKAVTVGSSAIALDASLEMRLDNTTFSGTVLGPGGAGLEAYVQIIANSKYGLNSSFYTSSAGAFAVSVQPGDYTLHVLRLQDKRAAMSTISLSRNVPLAMRINLTEAKYLSGKVTVGDVGAALDVSVSHGNAKLHLMSGSDGSFTVLVPKGNYTLSASTSAVESGITVAYSGSTAVSVNTTDVFSDFALARDTKRGVSAYWNSNLTQTAKPGVKVIYSFTITNTGNAEDLFLITFVGSGFDVSFSPSEVTLGFGVDNEATIFANVTAKSTIPAGKTKVDCLVRSKALASARSSIALYMNVAPVNGVAVTSLNTSQPVYSKNTVTTFRVNNTGNVDGIFLVQVANLPSLSAVGWTANIVDPTTNATVTEVNLTAFGSKELMVNFTMIRSNPDPNATASVLASSKADPGTSVYGSVPVMVPDLSIGPGGLQVVRGDVAYEYDRTIVYVDVALVASLAGMFLAFFFLRKKKGLGGGGKK